MELASTVLLLDHYAVIDGEEMSLLEITFKAKYLKLILDSGEKLGILDYFGPINDYLALLNATLAEQASKIEVPSLPEDVMDD